jgi:hypothetical protein|tara:strand:- start:24 stop:293 length:270 start_codon:yes stop_codon:yes gene_type:complete
MTKIRWQNNPDDYRNQVVPEEDVEWIRERDKKYKYHVTLVHKPTGMAIEQAGERCWKEAEDSCMQTLKWRIAHWDDYVQSRVRPLEESY